MKLSIAYSGIARVVLKGTGEPQELGGLRVNLTKGRDIADHPAAEVFCLQMNPCTFGCLPLVDIQTKISSVVWLALKQTQFRSRNQFHPNKSSSTLTFLPLSREPHTSFFPPLHKHSVKTFSYQSFPHLVLGPPCGHSRWSPRRRATSWKVSGVTYTWRSRTSCAILVLILRPLRCAHLRLRPYSNLVLADLPSLADRCGRVPVFWQELSS